MEVIQILLCLENVIGIYRNYLNYSIKAKCFIILRLLIDLILVVSISLLYLYNTYKKFSVIYTATHIMLFFHHWGVFYNCVILITTLIYLKKSKKFINQLKSVDEILKEDVEYGMAMRQRTVIFLVFTVSISLVRLIGFIMRILRVNHIIDDWAIPLLETNLYLVIQFWNDLRYIVENCVFAMFTNILAGMLKHFDKKIKSMSKQIRDKQQSLRKEDIDNWVTIYKYLALCGNNMNKLFNFQVCYYLLAY